MTISRNDPHPWAGTSADPADYPTVAHPELFVPDWPAFYWSAPELRARLQRTRRVESHRFGDDDPHQVLNVVRDHDAHEAPVIVYFHGGRWREGHPDFYDALGDAWAGVGAVFVSAGYRLSPPHALEDAIDDAVAAVRWVADHASDIGGDAARLWVTGHSAGAHLAAMAAVTRWPGAGELPIAGLICQSAAIDIVDMGRPAGEAESMDPSRVLAHAPAEVLIAYGVPEAQRRGAPGDTFRRHGQALLTALTNAGLPARVLELPDTDHLQVALAFGDPASELFAESRRLILGS